MLFTKSSSTVPPSNISDAVIIVPVLIILLWLKISVVPVTLVLNLKPVGVVSLIPAPDSIATFKLILVTVMFLSTVITSSGA